MRFAFLAAAATPPLGMLVSWPMVSAIDPSTLGLLLSLSAGALVYVGATHLLPRAEQERRRYSLVALAGGVAVAIVIVASKNWSPLRMPLSRTSASSRPVSSTIPSVIGSICAKMCAASESAARLPALRDLRTTTHRPKLGLVLSCVRVR